MPFRFSLTLFFLFQVSVLWRTLCSKRPYTSDDLGSGKITRQSISCFAAHLKKGCTDPVVVELQNNLARNSDQQVNCFRYLIGSIAVFGHVDGDALCTIHELCKAQIGDFLLELLEKLIVRNDCDTLVQFAVRCITINCYFNMFKHVLLRLMEEDWGLIGGLVMKIIAVLKDDTTRKTEYCLILRYLPAKLRYEMIVDRRIPLSLIGEIHPDGKSSADLRSIFTLARCSPSPDPEIRQHIAGMDAYFTQFLSDHTIEGMVAPCPENIPTLHSDVWWRIFMLLDTETVIIVLPSVCTSWRKSYSEVLRQNVRVRDLYLQDLGRVGWRRISKIAPWSYCLSRHQDALRYLSWLMMNDALDMTKPNTFLQEAAREYLEDVMTGVILPPSIGNYGSPYAFFLKLFGTVYEYCHSKRLLFSKPVFLTDEEYEQAVYHFACEKKWALHLPESLTVDNMSKLFSIIKEDEELMDKLIVENFSTYEEFSVILMAHAQTNSVPKKLIRLAFSKANIFREFVEPKFIRPSEYYKYIAEHDVLLKLMMECYPTDRVHKLVVNFILSLKGDLDKAYKIAARIAGQFFTLTVISQASLAYSVQFKLSESLVGTGEYLPEDIAFIRDMMTRFGWLRCKI